MREVRHGWSAETSVFRVPGVGHVRTGTRGLSAGQGAVVSAVVVALSTLALGVVFEQREGQFDAEGALGEDDLGLDGGDEQDCADASAGDPEV